LTEAEKNTHGENGASTPVQDAVLDEHSIPLNQVDDPLERLMELVVDREESIEQTINLLQLLKDKGFLNNISYFINDFEDLLDAGIGLVTKPGMLALFSIGSDLANALGEFDVTTLPYLTRTVNALAKGVKEPADSITVDGLLDILRSLKDPDVKIALRSIFGALKSMGEFLRSANSAQ